MVGKKTKNLGRNRGYLSLDYLAELGCVHYSISLNVETHLEAGIGMPKLIKLNCQAQPKLQLQLG